MELDGLMLCEKHAREAKLEEQIICWNAMLLHIDLWSKEAIRQNRPKIAELLELERLQVRTGLERAAADLELSRGRVKSLLRSLFVLDRWLEDNEGQIEDVVRIQRVKQWRKEAPRAA